MFTTTGRRPGGPDLDWGVVIVGGGLAGATTARALREMGYRGRLAVVDGIPPPGRAHPPAAQDVVGTGVPAGIGAFAPHLGDVELRLGTCATALAPDRHLLRLDDGTQLRYSRLVLATGAVPARLGIAGEDAAGVHHVTRGEDAARVLSAVGPGCRLVVVGRDWLALEVAAAARLLGACVTLLTGDGRGAAAPGALLGLLVALHEGHGVRALPLTAGEICTSAGAATGVLTADGTVVAADVVVVGGGTVPRTRLAELAGLLVDDGVITDAAMQAGDPDILAVGAVARHLHPLLGIDVREDGGVAAMGQAVAAASTLLGRRREYRELPRLRIDQYGSTVDHLGPPVRRGWRELLIGHDPAAGLLALWRDGAGTLKAATSVNLPGVADPLLGHLGLGSRVDEALLAGLAMPGHVSGRARTDPRG